MKVLVCSLPEQMKRTDLNALLPLLSQERKARIRRFLHIEDAYRSLIGDLLVSKMFSTNAPAQSKVVSTNEFGKPYFPEFPHCQFNVSHSGSWVVCVARHSEVGIDVEEHKAVDVRLAKQLFAAEDWTVMKDKEDAVQAFYDYWTRKESYVKAVGKGLTMPLDSFHVKDGSAPVHVRSEVGATEYKCHTLPIEPGYSMAVCAKHSPDRGDISIQRIPFDSLVHSIQLKEET